MTLLSDLPTEVLALIAHYIRSLPIVHAFAQTCRRANAAAQRRLYQLGRDKALGWALENNQVQTLRHVIAALRKPFPVAELNFACKCGHADIVAELLKLDHLLEFAVNPPQARKGHSPLYNACSAGQIEIVKLLLSVPGVDSNRHSGLDDETPLHAAAFHGHLEIANLLLDAGADPNAVTKKGRSPLFRAIHGTRDEMAKLLLERGASVDQRCLAGERPLAAAMKQGLKEKGAYDIAIHLLRFGAIPKETGDADFLSQCIVDSRHELISVFLEAGANSNLDLIHPVHMENAMRLGSRETCEILLVRGAKIPKPTGSNYTPMQWVCIDGDVEKLDLFYSLDPDKYLVQEPFKALLHCCHSRKTVEYLVDRGHRVDELDENGETCLTRLVQDYTIFRFAKSPGVLDACRAVLDYGADPCARTALGSSLPLVALCCNWGGELAQLLIEAGSDIHSPRGASSSDTLLHCFDVIQGNPIAPLISVLLERGIDVSAPGDDGRPPIAKASATRNAELLKSLIQHGADAHYSDHLWPNLLYAVIFYNESISYRDPQQCITILTKAGVDPNRNLRLGLTACQTAVLERKCISEMLQSGGDVNALATYGKGVETRAEPRAFPLLHALIRLERWQHDVRHLVKLGASLTAVDSLGQTALHVATSYPAPQWIIDKLIKYGADPKAKDRAGEEAGSKRKEALDKLRRPGQLLFIPDRGLIPAEEYDPDD